MVKLADVRVVKEAGVHKVEYYPPGGGGGDKIRDGEESLRVE